MVSKGASQFVLWPRYFDASLSRAQGRKVSDELAVAKPDAQWVEVAARRAGLEATLEADAKHPSVPYERSGRVLVAKGTSKASVLRAVAEKMKASQDKRE